MVLRRAKLQWLDVGKRDYRIGNDKIRDIRIITRKRYSFGVPVDIPVLQLLTLNGQKRDLIVGFDDQDYEEFKVLQQEIRIAVGLQVVVG